MYRIVKAAQPLVLVAVLFVAGALFGGQVVRGQLELAKKSNPMMVIPVDGPKPCTSC
jgi:uncharacterized protein with ACT and thioredoxin-like domain